MLSRDRLIEVLDYNAQTGVFTWKKTLSKAAPEGSIAGKGKSDEYTRIGIDGKLYLAHRLAWLYVNGHWPQHEIDRRDLNKNNNAIWNLRQASDSQNAVNRGVRKDNVLRIKNISKTPYGRYCVRTMKDKKRIFSRTFGTLDEAIAARNTALAKIHDEFARTDL